MKTLIQYLAVGSAGFIGATARLLVGRVSRQLFATDFPVGTLIINITGSFILGWFVTAVARGWTISDRISSETFQLMVAVGFVGSYTTFSTFMFESHQLLSQRETLPVLFGIANLVGSLAIGLLAVWLGIRVASR
jgi:CrcB protein